MRVLFDGYWWGEGPISNRTVQRQFFLAWKDQFPEDDLAILVRRSANTKDIDNLTKVYRTPLPLQALNNSLLLPIIGKKFRADLLVAHNFSPIWGTTAVFVHDYIFVDHPEWFSREENLYFRAMPLLSRFANKVFTSSRSEASRISRHLKDHVIPVGLALDPELSRALPHKPAIELEPGKFFLTVGRINVRKNLNAAITGALESGQVTPRMPLVVVGASSGRSDEMSPQVRSAVKAGLVILAGTVSAAELKWLYSHATLFMFLSLDEGFGLPCLEALEFGNRIVASDIPVFREILGSHATFVDPRDVTEISRAIVEELSRSKEITFKPDRSRDNYSWERSVKLIRQEFRTTTLEEI